MTAPRIPNRAALALVLLASTVFSPWPEARATLNLVTQRSVLKGSDFIDWGQFPNEYQIIPNPFTAVSQLGDLVTVRQAVPYPFMRLTENYGAGQGNFTPGDPVLYTNNYTRYFNPITLTDFNGYGIAAGGLQIRANWFGPFMARIEAFDAGQVSLGWFDVPGDSNIRSDDSGLFIGVTSDIPIASLSISLLSATDNRGSYAVNQFDFTPFPNPQPVPAPLALLGVSAAAAFSRKFRRRISSLQSQTMHRSARHR